MTELDNQIDITPDPKVLIALTHTPLNPVDALCELIDNALDSFALAKRQGDEVAFPLVGITVPGANAVRRGESQLRIVDNGVGLTKDGLANTLRAGFSGKNRYDSLGLFGMGFNIATGKLGRTTVVTTARKSDAKALRVVIDLPTLVESRSFNVPVSEVEKPANFTQGTIVEVRDWWPDGSPNANFPIHLAAKPKAQLLELVGRRYATILRGGGEHPVAIQVNGTSAQAFEACVWSSERFVERKGWGNIAAKKTFDEVLREQRRCSTDGSVIPEGESHCSECGQSNFRTISERVRGWVGIQRYDDNNKFGIDLIRNGRAIRVHEKEAFFNSVNEVGESVKEYPTDQQSGRIVGEVHLDHIPVDFQKQDFQRTTEEWQRAVAFLRGGSLLPSAWTEGERNSSPISLLFQGYRKVRNFGKPDMYMGRYDEVTGRAVRISRDIEADMVRKFYDRADGYVDDAKWWEIVESATVPPIQGLTECAECGYENVSDSEVCNGCSAVLLAKGCLSCGISIPVSSVSCPTCGASQVPEVSEPWQCQVCEELNDADIDACRRCSALRGVPNPMDGSHLRSTSLRSAELSFSGVSVDLSDGKKSEPLDVEVWSSPELRPTWRGEPVGSVSFIGANKIDVFLDFDHPTYTHLAIRPHDVVAVEAAQYLYAMRTDLVGQKSHSVRTLATSILAAVWGEELAETSDRISESMRRLFNNVSDRLLASSEPSSFADFYRDLDQFEQRELADKLIVDNRLVELTEMIESGAYLGHVGPGVLARHFAAYPDVWFGSVWSEDLPKAETVGEEAARNGREQLVGVYKRCLEDCASYLRYSFADKNIVARAKASRNYLEERLQ